MGAIKVHDKSFDIYLSEATIQERIGELVFFFKQKTAYEI